MCDNRADVVQDKLACTEGRTRAFHLMVTVSAGPEAKVAALELPGGVYIKVDPAATPTQFLQAASTGDTQEAAALLVGQVVGAGGLCRAPLVLLASHTEVTKLLARSTLLLAAIAVLNASGKGFSNFTAPSPAMALHVLII